ncbi:MAG: sigma-70 family RNA polymerase sigma factor [Myxococcales bacterium]|nr:sigma-70 family RNA polymerase sigma factor [Myxococcales bacterium]
MRTRTQTSSASTRAKSSGPEPVRESGARRAPANVDSDSEGFLTPYFREMATHDVMSRDEELAAAIRIAKLRRTYWASILSYPPFIPGILELARQHLDAKALPQAEIEAMLGASRKLRDRDLVAHQQAFEAARAALAERLAEADVDGVVSERVLADLTAIEAGQGHPLTMNVKLPRKGSRPFLEYVARVRRNNQALWVAKNAFVRANLRLVVTIARRFNHGRMPFQDLIQEGNIGLMKAVDRFDHRKGFRFSTYGSWWIRHAISRAIADKARAVRLPVHMIDAYNKVRKARRAYEAEHGRRPTDAEVAGLTGVSVERISRMRWSLVESPLSLDQPLSEDRDRTMLDGLEDPDLVETPALMESQVLHETLQEVFASLAPIEADILRKRMGLDDEERLTLKEIGELYSLSRERIRQLQEQALGKLRSEFRRRELLD